jgi:serine/threonine-protein kinase HipA
MLLRFIGWLMRFDRIPNGATYRRLPFISGLTITGAHESESSQQSYRRPAEQLRLFGSDKPALHTSKY